MGNQKESEERISSILNSISKLCTKDKLELIDMLKLKYCFECGSENPCCCWNDE